MTDKEQAECLIQLHKDESAKHKDLINLEFKINISIWTFITLAGYYILNDGLPNWTCRVISNFVWLYPLLSILIIVTHYKFWLFPITKSQAISNYYIKSYLCKIETLAQFSISINKDKSEIKSFCDLRENYKKWICFELGIKVFLLLLIYIFVLLQFFK
jgi:hypothetical protein